MMKRTDTLTFMCVCVWGGGSGGSVAGTHSNIFIVDRLDSDLSASRVLGLKMYTTFCFLFLRQGLLWP